MLDYSLKLNNKFNNKVSLWCLFDSDFTFHVCMKAKYKVS